MTGPRHPDRITATDARVGDTVARGGPDSAFRVVAIHDGPRAGYLRIDGPDGQAIVVRCDSYLDRYGSPTDPLDDDPFLALAVADLVARGVSEAKAREVVANTYLDDEDEA